MNEKIKTTILALQAQFGEIQIRCKGADSLPLDAILDFQGGLKKLSHGNLLRLAGSIFKEGFCAPFFIWQNKGECFCLDGHQRLATLIAIREAGIPIPGLFPVAYIEAETKQEAREKLLVITSQYGEFQRDQLDSWIGGINDIIRLVNTEIEIISITDEEIEDEKLTEEKLEPYKKIHVLLSMSPETFFEIQEFLKKIKSLDGVEYEQSKN